MGGGDGGTDEVLFATDTCPFEMTTLSTARSREFEDKTDWWPRCITEEVLG